MPLSVKKLAGHLGAEVDGITIDGIGAAAAELVGLLAEHGVIFLPAGVVDDFDDHRRLAEALGERVVPHAALASLEAEGAADIGIISTTVGNLHYANVWHADVTWKPEPSRYSVLRMQVCPEAGGDTCWSSQIAAYAALSDPLKQLLDGLTARHSLPGRPDDGVDHPVVISHPLTGKPSLFVNRLFTNRINELTPQESAALLDLLFDHSTKIDFTCRKNWSAGEVGIWDNHFVQHYSVIDYHDVTRTIHRIEVAPEAPHPA